MADRRILIVEDDTGFGTMLKHWFGRNGFEAVLCGTVDAAKKEIASGCFDLVLSDLRLPDDDGIMLLSWIREQKRPIPFIIMTSYGEIQTAVAAMKLGAFDFMQKPVNNTALKEKIEQALGGQTRAVQPKQAIPPSSPSHIIGSSRAARELDNLLLKVAPTLMSVLILGESGTGKEFAARRIHELSHRSKGSFIAVDCGSLSRELAPSELFGHLKGSFTSSISDKKGVFEQAGGGTVFLDEIGNLSYEVQVQLLRCLQERKVRPVGSATDIPVDVRIIVATNENLPDAIAQSRFREDLYHRLNEFSVVMPALRERKEDIELFASHFLQQANSELGKQIRSFTADTLDIFRNYYWGGNLRELRNVVRRSALFAEGDVITPSDLPILSDPLLSQEMVLRPGTDEEQKEQIETAVRRANGNKTLAAKLLKIDRKTLYNMMHRFGMGI